MPPSGPGACVQKTEVAPRNGDTHAVPTGCVSKSSVSVPTKGGIGVTWAAAQRLRIRRAKNDFMGAAASWGGRSRGHCILEARGRVGPFSAASLDPRNVHSVRPENLVRAQERG